MVSNKPLYVRLTWLMVFLFMLGLFIKGFADFVIKLQLRQVTTSLEADGANFRFPDVYVCFENPISGSYSAAIDNASVDVINAQLSAFKNVMSQQFAILGYPSNVATLFEREMSSAYPQSLEYQLLVNTMAHRTEQAVITSDLLYNTDYGMPVYQSMEPITFYHPEFLRCLRWTLNNTWQDRIVQTGTSSGLVLTLVVDANFSDIQPSGAADRIQQLVYARDIVIPVSDWSLSVSDYNGPDRGSGVRVFLTPPGEYPSDFVTSFSLGTGKFHTVEIDMLQEVHRPDQFECVNDGSSVQFVDPYNQAPYSHAYSYSYCYYYEYHKRFQELVNMSGITGPLPWPLREKKFVMNLTGEPTVFVFFRDPTLEEKSKQFANQTKKACQSKKPCSTLDYSVSISSADWPTQSSLAPFVSSSIKQAWTSAKAKNLSVPALDFLLTSSNASSVASYVRSNLLKVHFKPHRVLCDRITFSIDYGLQNFISDVGGIMGIYLGMSLLTICEIFEMVHDILLFGRSKSRASPPSPQRSSSSPKRVPLSSSSTQFDVSTIDIR